MSTDDTAQVLRPDRTAILAMDFTEPIVEHYASDGPGAVARAVEVLDAARSAGASVVHVLPGALDGLEMTWSAGEPHADLRPQPGDTVVGKSRIGAFSGAGGLDAGLRADGRDVVVLTGIATSGVVLSTARAAFDLGYTVVVVDDACSDPDPAVHELLTRPVHPESWVGLWRIATVLSSADVCRSMATTARN